MTAEHTVKSFDEELEQMAAAIGRMGGLAEMQVERALRAVVARDSALAEAVVRDDRQLDDLEHEIIERTVRLLALRQPVAQDLRRVVAAMRIAPDLERIGDYAKNVAKRTIAVCRAPSPAPVAAIPRMGRMVQAMTRDVLDAWTAGDADRAREVWARDAEVDALLDSMFRELLACMMQDPDTVSACTHLMFIAKNIERIGDLATNIAETVVFREEGRMPDLDRPKGDWSNFAVVAPGDAAGGAGR